MSAQYLLVDSEGNAVKIAGEIKIGRADTNDIILSDPLASRHHSTVYTSENKIMIRDENSINGTLLNGKKIYEPMELRENDHLQFGDEVFIVRAPLDVAKTINSAGTGGIPDHQAKTTIMEAEEKFSREPVMENQPVGSEKTHSGGGFKKDQKFKLVLALLIVIMVCVCCILTIIIYFLVFRNSTSLISLINYPRGHLPGFVF